MRDETTEVDVWLSRDSIIIALFVVEDNAFVAGVFVLLAAIIPVAVLERI